MLHQDSRANNHKGHVLAMRSEPDERSEKASEASVQHRQVSCVNLAEVINKKKD